MFLAFVDLNAVTFLNVAKLKIVRYVSENGNEEKIGYHSILFGFRAQTPTNVARWAVDVILACQAISSMIHQLSNPGTELG